MRAVLIIDGRFVGELTYELPKDDRGRSVALPSKDFASQVDVIIVDPNDEKWTGRAKLERA